MLARLTGGCVLALALAATGVTMSPPAASALDPGAGVASAEPSQRFTNAGFPQSYLVPPGVRVVRVTARGGGGGGGRGGPGGSGARVTSDVAVIPGEVLRVDVGAGGAGGVRGAGGYPSTVRGLGVLVVAGGGGGAGDDSGAHAAAGRASGRRDAVADPADLGSGRGRGGTDRGGRGGHSFVHSGQDGLPAGEVRRLAAGDRAGAGSGGAGGADAAAGRAGVVVIRPLAADRRLDAPVIRRIRPATGPSAGGNEVTIRGRGLHRVDVVQIGGRAATDLIVVGDREVRVLAPAHPVGRVDVSVVAHGSTAVARTAYTFR